jgi:hypothetical protein
MIYEVNPDKSSEIISEFFNINVILKIPYGFTKHVY